MRILRSIGFSLAVVYLVFIIMRMKPIEVSLSPISVFIILSTSIISWVLSGISWLLIVKKEFSITDFIFWGQTEFLKYLPGGVWNQVSRKKSLPSKKSSKTHIFGLLYSLEIFAASTCSLIFLNLTTETRSIYVVYSCISLALFSVSLALSSYFFYKLELNASRIATIIVLYFIHWLGIFLQLHIILKSFSYENSFLFPAIYGSYALSWVVGFLTIFVPNGLAVREAFFVKMLLVSKNSFQLEVLAILVLRLITYLLELILGLTCICFAFFTRKKS